MKEFKFKTTPYAHQLKALRKVYGKEGAALLMQQGTGKSKVAIDVASNLYMDGEIDAVLLIAPNNVHTQWHDEQLPIHSCVPTKGVVWKSGGGKAFKYNLHKFVTGADRHLVKNKLKWFFVNVEAFSTSNNLAIFKNYVSMHRTLVIVDEATRIKSPTANRTINITQGLADTEKSRKRVTSIDPLSAYRLILSGTIVTNAPSNLFAPYEFLKFDFFKMNYYAFNSRYCMQVKETGDFGAYTRNIRPDEIERVLKYHRYNRPIEEISEVTGISTKNIEWIIANPNNRLPYKNLSELKLMIEPVSVVVRKDECLDIPPKVYQRIEVNLGGEQKRVYNELKKKLIAEYNDKELTVANKLTLTMRLQQVTGGFFPYQVRNEDGDPVTEVTEISSRNAKITALKEDLWEADNEKIIVWARFTAEIKAIERELKKAFPEKVIVSYYGETGDYRREEIKKQFKAGQIDIMVANPRVAGIGLNLQIATLHYYYSNSFSLDDREQSEDRSHRMGQTKTVTYKDIVIKGSIDEHVREKLIMKTNLLEYFRSHSLTQIMEGK